MAGSFRAGKSGRVTIGTVPQNLALMEWSVTARGADLDTTNFESQGIEEGLIGIIGADWSLRGNWDAAMNPLADPPGLFPRDNGVAMNLIPSVAGALAYSFPLWRCLNSKITTTTTGLVTFDADGKNQGPFGEPAPPLGRQSLRKDPEAPPARSRPVVGEWETQPVPAPGEVQEERSAS